MHSLARIVHLLLLACLLSASGFAVAAEPLILAGKGGAKLAPYIEYFREKDAPLALDDARQVPDSEWHRPASGGYMVLGLTEDTYWMRLSLVVSENRDWELSLRYFFNCSADIYVRERSADGQVGTFQNLATVTRWDQRHYSVPLPLKAGASYDIYMRVGVPGPDKFAFVIEDGEAKKHFDLWDNRWVGVFYGGFITMLLYNLFLAISTRSFTYGYYLLYMIAMMSYLMMMDGLWQAPLSHYYIAICAVAAFGCQFCRYFLHTRSLLPGPDKFIVGIIGCALSLGGLLIVLGPMTLLTMLVMVLVAGYGLVLGSVGLLSRLRGNHVARFFLLAWFFPLIGMIYTDLMFTGFVPFTDVGYASMNIVTLIESILLSMALADRINVLRAQRQSAILDSKQKLEFSNRALEKANRLKDSFLGTISHELRTPMNGIIGTLELLKSSRLDQQQHECLATLDSSSGQMLAMVERILLFSELQSGAVKLQPTTLDVLTWFGQLQRDWAPAFEEKGVHFSAHIDPACSPWLTIDIRKLNHLLTELLSNALKFTSEGDVRLMLSQASESESAFWTLDINDTGIGIPEDQILKISDAFQQGQSAYNRQYGGLGIGMAICRELVTALKGEWRIESTPGSGTFIRLVIPVAVAEAPKAAKPDSRALPSMNGTASVDNGVTAAESRVRSAETSATSALPDVSLLPTALEPPAILVVEDNAVNQMVMKKILESLGWTYCIANNGVEALEKAADKPYALILMDCQMPVMDGLEATRQLRAGSTPNRLTPIVAVTANATDLDRENCIACGMNDYLKKPVKPHDIRDIIARYVPAGAVEAVS